MPDEPSSVSDPRPESPATSEADRRKSFRLNRVLGAELDHGGEVTRLRLFVIDISATGFRATNHAPLPVDEDLGVSIALTSSQAPLCSRARVVWQKELSLSGMFQCGFEFREMSEPDRERLEAFIEAERQKGAPQHETPYLGRPWTTIH